MLMVDSLQDFAKQIGEVYTERIAYRYKINNKIIEKSYKQLQNDSERIGAYLHNICCVESKIAILGETSYEWIATYLGITGSKNIAVAMDVNLLIDELCNMIEFAEISCIFASKRFKDTTKLICEKCKRIKNVFIFEEDYDNLINNSFSNEVLCKREDLAQLVFTSGTTGVSKVVMLSHGNIIASTCEHSDVLPMYSVALSVLPIHHCYELFSNNLNYLSYGSTICINDAIENMMTNINLFKPEILSIVPLIAKKLNRIAVEITRQLPDNILEGKSRSELREIYKVFHSMLGGNVKIIIIGGAATAPELIKSLSNTGIQVIAGYGLTETASATHFNNTSQSNEFESVGIPYDNNVQAKVVNGELCIKSPSVMMGYYKNKEATNNAIKDGWLYTGDLASIDENGFVKIIGRVKNLIILDNGKNIYPEELEGYLEDIDVINNAVVYEDKGKIAAIIQVNSDNEDNIAKIDNEINEVNNLLPAYKKIMITNYTTKKFPLTTSNKVKRLDVISNIDMYVNKQELEYIPPQSDKQKLINLVIKDILKLNNDISINANIFDLGMDSLAAVELGTTLDISIQEIYECLTIENLARLIEDNITNIDEDESEFEKINKIIVEDSNIELDNIGNTILLTGATGFLGSHILKELIDMNYQVVCLVRSKKKLEEVFNFYFANKLPDSVSIIKGNIEDKLLGLDEITYNRLADNIDMVIHTAANVHHIGNYNEFEKTNVIGTSNIIDFCLKSKAVMHHTSTYSVSGIGVVEQRDSDGVFNEFKLNIGQKYTQNVYVHSKYEAEKKVLLARENGLVANIYRIGSLTWSKDGKFQVNASENGLVRRIKGISKLKIYTEEMSKYPMDFTPVDECAKAFALLVSHNKANNIYHLFNPNVVTINHMEDIYNCSFKKVSNKEFYQTVNNSDDSDVKVYSMYNQMATNSKSIPMDASFTNSILREKKFEWTKVDKEYIDRYNIDYV